MPGSWELIIVNDGSSDDSLAIAKRWEKADGRVRVISYGLNQGRGYALKKGIEAAQGDIVVTTEIDLSWGDSITTELYAALVENPKMEFAIASPNLPGGGYKNVPFPRVKLSRLGHRILRLFFSFDYTMYTGMTRAYRREVIQSVGTREKGKEFHLEVLLKLTALGYRGMEIPAILEWRDHKLRDDPNARRKSSSRIAKLVRSHLRFAVFANPLRYFWALAAGGGLTGIVCILIGIVRLAVGKVAIFFILLGLLLMIVSLIFFGFGIVTAQNRVIMEELWLLKKKQP
jgi:glycosyltransferase involved in cell wall biosynthesis